MVRNLVRWLWLTAMKHQEVRLGIQASLVYLLWSQESWTLSVSVSFSSIDYSNLLGARKESAGLIGAQSPFSQLDWSLSSTQCTPWSTTPFHWLWTSADQSSWSSSSPTWERVSIISCGLCTTPSSSFWPLPSMWWSTPWLDTLSTDRTTKVKSHSIQCTTHYSRCLSYSQRPITRMWCCLHSWKTSGISRSSSSSSLWVSIFSWTCCLLTYSTCIRGDSINREMNAWRNEQRFSLDFLMTMTKVTKVTSLWMKPRIS